MNKVYNTELVIPKSEIAKYEKLLESENLNFDDLGFTELTTIKMWTVKFPDGCFVDLKVNTNQRCEGDLYAEAVLFDKEGHQLDFSDAFYDIQGPVILESKDAEYHINVVSGDDKAKYYKVIVTTTYYTERIVKANSKEEVENASGEIVSSINLMNDIPDVNTDIEERPDMDDDDVDIDLTKGE